MPNININELMRAIIRIRDNIDKVEVKGQENRACLYYAYNDCNMLLKQLGMILEEGQKQQLQKEAMTDGTDKNS